MFLTAKHPLGLHSRAMALLMRSQRSMKRFQCPLDTSEAMALLWGSSLLGDPEDNAVVLQCQHGWHLTQGEGYSLL